MEHPGLESVHHETAVLPVDAINRPSACATSPNSSLIDDSDTQAKWYYHLKAAYQKQQTNGGGPVQATIEPVTLRWRS